MIKNFKFKEVVIDKKGFLRGPFGGDLKKEIFVEQSDNTYKVYEQGVVLNSDKNIGRYYISEKDYLAKLHKFSVQDKDFLISCSGVNMGAIYQLKEPFERGVINQALLRIRLDNKIIDDNYFFYLFKELISKRITSGSGDSTIPNFPALEVIKNIEFELPLLCIQEKVGKILLDIDLKIKLNNKINTELEAMAKTLYDYWFVQLDFPNVNGKPYKTSGGKMVWNEELKREIPKGWEIKTFSEWINNDKSGDWGKEIKEGNYNQKVYCIRGADINGLNGTGELKSPERYILEKNLHKTLEPADLIVEISGGSPVQSTGRLAFVTEETLKRFDAPIICSNFCKAVTLKNKKLLYNFVYHWKSIYDAGVLFGYEGKTSGIKNLLFDSFMSSHYTVFPNENIMEKFYEFIEPIQIKKQKNLKENQELVSLRDWLLPMLMNGQITISDTQKEMV
jgi:type I restriction enzyme S subunit